MSCNFDGKLQMPYEAFSVMRELITPTVMKKNICNIHWMHFTVKSTSNFIRPVICSLWDAFCGSIPN